MTSRVEELQRMCDNINENGGLDSGEWHTALLAQIAQNLAVIADVMMADRKTENNSEKPNNFDKDINVRSKDDAYFLELMGAVERGEISDAGANQAWYEYISHKDEPQIDCGDFADRLAYERGVKHAWEVAQKVFDSTVTFYEAEDVAKQITKGEPQTDCPWK